MTNLMKTLLLLALFGLAGCSTAHLPPLHASDPGHYVYGFRGDMGAFVQVK